MDDTTPNKPQNQKILTQTLAQEEEANLKRLISLPLKTQPLLTPLRMPQYPSVLRKKGIEVAVHA